MVTATKTTTTTITQGCAIMCQQFDSNYCDVIYNYIDCVVVNDANVTLIQNKRTTQHRMTYHDIRHRTWTRSKER